MATISFWLGKDIDESKLKKLAENQNKSVSKLINNSLKNNFDVLKKKK